jgi:hypothetical protein
MLVFASGLFLAIVSNSIRFASFAKFAAKFFCLPRDRYFLTASKLTVTLTASPTAASILSMP